MLRLAVATRNKGKLREIREILPKTGIELFPSDSFQGAPDPEETGSTYSENAAIKARALCAFTGLPAISDDSGLEIDALDGAPGVYSARYAGNNQDAARNRKKVLAEMAGVQIERRSARFVCVIALAEADGTIHTFNGACEGTITTEEHGANGFGYDPIFLVPVYGKTMAELEPDIKNRISHRRQALEKLREFLETGAFF